MKPLHYFIHLEPDMNTFSFKGITEIEIENQNPVKTIIVNAKQLEFSKIEVTMGKMLLIPTYTLDEKKEELTLTLETEIQNNFSVKFVYTGIINDKLLGWYRSRYEQDGETKYLATTQFEERHARQVFPGFDHPSLRATFNIEFLIDENMVGIGPTGIESETKDGAGKKLVKFEKTVNMTTYALYFGVGDFEFIEDRTKSPTIRVAGPPGRVEYGQFALDVGRKSNDFGEEYTGIPYPMSKCDHIAIADFAFGAMENYGAVAYRENALLVYPGKTSKKNLVRIGSVIAHEVSHMWFGNLVSPADWKYIWLNESFASYFTHAIPDKYFPEWKMWDTFVLEQMMPGFERDSFCGTLPIELPGDGEVNIDASTAPIIYNKGASVLRMLNGYLGEEKFKKGIHFFLKKFKYQSVTSQQYWEAFEEATGEPIKDFANSWVFTKGYPIITATQEGTKLHLTQERFGFLPVDTEKPWTIPLTVRIFLNNGESKLIRQMMTTTALDIELPPETAGVKINDGFTGFYRVKYSDELLLSVEKLLAEGKFGGNDKFSINNDYFQLVKRGDYSIDEYLSFLERNFLKETDFLPLIDIFDHLNYLYRVNAGKSDAIKAVGRKLAAQAISVIGFEPKESDSLLLGEARSMVIGSGFRYGLEQMKEFGLAKFTELREGKPVNADLLSTVMKIGAVVDPMAKEYFLSRLMDAAAPEVEKVNIIMAIGLIPDETVLKELLKLNMEKIPMRNRFYIPAVMSKNPVAQSFLWDWVKENAEYVAANINPSHLGRIFLHIAPYCAIGRYEEVKAFLEEFCKTHEYTRPSAELALEALQVNSNVAK